MCGGFVRTPAAHVWRGFLRFIMIEKSDEGDISCDQYRG